MVRDASGVAARLTVVLVGIFAAALLLAGCGVAPLEQDLTPCTFPDGTLMVRPPGDGSLEAPTFKAACKGAICTWTSSDVSVTCRGTSCAYAQGNASWEASCNVAVEGGTCIAPTSTSTLTVTMCADHPGEGQCHWVEAGIFDNQFVTGCAGAQGITCVYLCR